MPRSFLVVVATLGICAPMAEAHGDERSPYSIHEREYTAAPVKKWRTTWSQPKYFEFDQVQLLHYLLVANAGVRAEVDPEGIILNVTHMPPGGRIIERSVRVAKVHVQLPDPRINKPGEPAIRFNDAAIPLDETGIGKHRISVELVSGLWIDGRKQSLVSSDIGFEVVRFDALRHVPKDTPAGLKLNCLLEQWTAGPEQGPAYWEVDLDHRGDKPVTVQSYNAKASLSAGKRVLCLAGSQRLIPDFGWHRAPGSLFCGAGLEEVTFEPERQWPLRFYEIRGKGLFRFDLSYVCADASGEAGVLYSPPFIVERRGVVVPVAVKR